MFYTCITINIKILVFTYNLFHQNPLVGGEVVWKFIFRPKYSPSCFCSSSLEHVTAAGPAGVFLWTG